jgi:1-acyl-sn-glycerol-3-phosphate acyltransferase
MLTLSYKNFRSLLRTLPICPKPKAIGLENIPKDEPTLFVYNHVTRRGEPLFLGLAAPARPGVRFFADMALVSDHQLSTTRKDLVNSIFSQKWQQKIGQRPWMSFCFERFSDFLTRFLHAQINRFHVIPAYLHHPSTEEGELKKSRRNKKALRECLECLESHIPVAIAPSGGRTHEAVETSVSGTIVPTLASMLCRRGKVVKIVPSVVKERPEINKKTYKKYVADRIPFYRFLRWSVNKIRGNSYTRPRLTVEFLPPLTFAKLNPEKAEKVRFVAELQQIMYTSLKKDN